MIVCHCHAVNERSVRRAVREGASSTAAVALRCGAGAGCGGCHPVIEEIVEEECAASASARAALPSLGASR